MKAEKLLSKAKKQFSQAQDAWSENRQAALEDIKFARMGEQWPEEIKRQRELEGRPCLTINRLPTFIRQVVNDARLNSPSIKVHPVDDNSDPETAEVVNGIIRNIEASSNASVAYDHALESAVTCGEGFFRINMDYAYDDSFLMDLSIERIANPLSVYFDPNSMEVDASDWTYCFVIEEMSHDEFKSSYPNAEISDWDSDSSHEGWVTEDTVRVAEWWTREEVDTEIFLLSNGMTINQEQYESNPGLFQQFQIVEQRATKTYKVKQRIITSAEVLEETDWPGKFIPIVPCFGDEVIVEGKRHFLSLTRPAMDSQRNFNYWRTAATEKVALATKAPWIGPVGAFDTDAKKWETANQDTHPFIEYDGPIPPQQTPPSMVDAGSMQEAMNASDDLKSIMGLFNASLGASSAETSGKAILARQREGDVSTFHFIDNLSRAIRYAGRVLLDLIPKVYNQPRVMRVMGYDGTPDSVQVNQEFDVNGMIRMHDLTVGKYDLVVETGPSFSTQREEAATQMTELLRSFPQAAPIIGDLVAKNLDWPGADEIAKRLKILLPPQIQQMENMDGLPPEAQAAIAQAEQQITELTQVIEQGQQILAEKDEQIKQLEVAQKSKQEEIQIKAIDSERKFTADMAKIEMEKYKVELQEREENRRLLIEESIQAMKDQQSANQEALVNNITQLSDHIRNKRMSITAPSGETYNAIVQDGEIVVDAPSGTYTGQIEES